ncbi:DJ-1/PfpI family protein [Rhizobium sp. VS19-DR104.2]|uniref:DJ-1/PfpI family protein n=1 Tax=unclassified Rhizobium TaxID=2613769 RepID=UPI001CC40560|nr:MULTISPECIES: DJ-1/PfpI family protein [unclassified Rhizobium]MBZ5763405.1 DJ-1/PfpI family protein [Rhizobium sp. VS19-DR96]MBZ5769300.1 DJ-1/PfpI family protein [Rhizobium sp. VS19-DR129.2]MBZ5776823.1 DJ-1/PfpI family protein [Rhizobium sp. VS19-DRK62.2]MBZ5787957.1 DJ-1/PfpI family protein [Rhizobium sp. VS19-DR121]MBZ5805402.1 DJ-1/PfpI family protein [Rhizobium sp. VS19-DR181]
MANEVSFRFLCFPAVQQLDLTGPYEVFASADGAEVHLVWKDLEPVRSSTGLWLKPDTRFADAPDFDVLCVPGGAGVNALLFDQETLAFVRDKAAKARFVTSVCTGSLVLGQAGLLEGRRATTHWNAHAFLERFGAVPAKERVVRDGSLITAGGVTSGIDFGLTVVAELLGREEAEIIQLSLEYAPAPPFSSGLPETAPSSVLAAARARMAGSRAEREALLVGRSV